MPFHAIDIETEISYYSFLYDWTGWQALMSEEPDMGKRLVASCCGSPVRARRNIHSFGYSPEVSFAHRHKPLACPVDNHSYTHVSQPLKILAFRIASEFNWKAVLETHLSIPGESGRIYVDALVKTDKKSKAVIFHAHHPDAIELIGLQDRLTSIGVEPLWIIPHTRALPPPEPARAIAVEDRGRNFGAENLAFQTILFSRDNQARTFSDPQALRNFLLDQMTYVSDFRDEPANVNLACKRMGLSVVS